MIAPDVERALAVAARAARELYPRCSDQVAVLSLFERWGMESRARRDLLRLDSAELRADVWRFLESTRRE